MPGGDRNGDLSLKGNEDLSLNDDGPLGDMCGDSMVPVLQGYVVKTFEDL